MYLDISSLKARLDDSVTRGLQSTIWTVTGEDEHGPESDLLETVLLLLLERPSAR